MKTTLGLLLFASIGTCQITMADVVTVEALPESIKSNALAQSPFVKKHIAMLLEKFPNAKFTEIEKENYQGQEVYEYEFEFKGKAYEAFITQNGDVLRIGLD